MAGINSLKRGYIWRVGNGQNINIWEDAWIPNCATRKVVTPKGGQLLTKVGDLIDPASNTWDEDLITQTMWPIDVQRILSIPISRHDMPDLLLEIIRKMVYSRFGLLILWSVTISMEVHNDILTGWGEA